MKKCKYCMSEIDSNAKICPICGKKQKSNINIIIILLAIFIIGGIIFAVRNDAENTKKELERIRISGEKGLDEWLNNTSDLELEDGLKGSMDSIGFAYYIEGYVKNNSTKNFNYVSITFTTYDKDGNTIGTCLDNNSGLDAKGRWKFKAMCLDQVKEIASYKLKEITKY